MKRMFLASQAKHPTTIKHLRDYIGQDFNNLSVAYIPTALNGETYGSWKKSDSLKVVKSLGFKIEIV